MCSSITSAGRQSQGHGFVNDQEKPTSFRAPGFPLFLAGLYLLAGQNFPLAYVSFCVLGAVTCLLTWLLAREVLEERLAFVAAVLVALYPPYVHLATTFMSENLFVPLLALGVWLVLRYLKTHTLATLAFAGLALGAATLTRPFSLLLLPIVAGVLAWSAYRAGRLRLGPIFVFGVAFLAVIAPWTYRNYSVHGRFVLIATNGGSTFYGGNNGKVVSTFRNYGSWFSTTELPHRDLIDATPDEVAHDKMEWQLGCDWLTSNPRYLASADRWQGGPPLLLGAGVRRGWTVGGGAAGYLPFLVLLIPGFFTCLRAPVLDAALAGNPWDDAGNHSDRAHLLGLATLSGRRRAAADDVCCAGNPGPVHH